MALKKQDASEMLAAALQQMDGLIAGTKYERRADGAFEPTPSGLDIVTAAEELRMAIELDLCETQSGDLPDGTRHFIARWLGGADAATAAKVAAPGGRAVQNGFGSHSLPSAAELQEKLKRLEGDKASLQLQVQVLSEQVEAQTEKIVDLERNLGSKRDKLGSTEQLLQTEMVTRSSLETHKLDLMTEISNMKLKVAALEKEKIEMHEALHTAQIDYKLMQSKLTDRESEIAGIKFKQGAPSHATSLFGRSHESPAEVEKLRQALENMVVANEEKDRVIDDLKKTVNRFKRVQEIVAGPSPRKPHGDPGADDDLSEFSGINIMAKPTQERCHTMPSPSATSTPLGSWLESPTIVTGKPPISGPPAVAAATGKPPHGNMAAMREDYSAANSCEDVNPYQEKTPPTQRRNTSDSAQQREFPRDAEHQNPHIEAYGTMGPDHQRKHSKQKGIMKLFGRLRRSSSQNLEDKHQQQGAPPGSPEAAATNGTFQRGGFRATAGPRLAWSRDLKPGELDTPFARWDGDKVAMWVHEIGLSAYVIDSKRWVKNGDQLLRATPQDLEKELGIHNPLHRKKLQLALQAVGSEEMDAKCNLDHHWVTRWLDDVGLPQYKESFSDARVDGRMLHYLTVEDLLQMKVTNILHHVSLKRGIQLLRLHNYNPNCLRRRPTDMEGVDNDPRDVMLWTNHRVMEWLRTADLSEYAPNLRGSGVHGALIILENRFNAELLAQILNIPASKTLLRRHLSTHYTSLVGQDCLKRKRDVEVAATFVALSPSQKLKPKTRGLFRKKSKENIDYDEYVCPMDIQGPSGHCVTRAGALPRQNSDPLLAKKEAQVAHEVGAFSREIDTLTTMIQKDVDMLNESVPTSDV